MKTVLVANAAWKAAIPVVESCVGQGYRVLAIAPYRYFESGFCKGNISRIRCPDASRDATGFVHRVLEILAEIECDAVIPVGHLETDLLAAHQERIRAFSGILVPPYETFEHGLKKSLTMKAALRIGCPIPLTWFPRDEPIEQIAERVTFPVIIKPSVSVSAKGLVICESRKDLVERYPITESRFGETIVQEYIPQEGMQYKCAVICNARHEVMSAITYEKIRYYPVDGGFSTLNRSVMKEELITWAMEMVKNLRWVGPCDFDWITDPRDGAVKLMEINPRFSETFKMSSVAGLDMTKILLELVRGESPEKQMGFRQEVYLRYLLADLLWFLSAGSKRWKTQPSFFRFFAEDTHYLEFGTRNWKPILGTVLKNIESRLGG